jgi:hypothetical protein
MGQVTVREKEPIDSTSVALKASTRKIRSVLLSKYPKFCFVRTESVVSKKAVPLLEVRIMCLAPF